MQVRARLRRGLRAGVAMALASTTAVVAFSAPSAGTAVEPDAAAAQHHDVSPQVLTSPGGPDAPHIAYTSDSDKITGMANTFAANGAHSPRHLHVGELSNESNGYFAFVSADSNNPGTVYLGYNSGGSHPAPSAITCDNNQHSHPVVLDSSTLVLPIGQTVANEFDDVVLIAYATTVNGTQRIDVTAVDETVVAATGTVSCNAAGVTTYTLPNQSGDDFWPTWGPVRPAGDEGQSGVPTLIYASTRDAPLGDLYYQPLIDASSATRLFGTDTPDGVGNTEPFFVSGQNSLLFTTTMFRADESLGTTKLSFPSNSAPDQAPTTSGLNSAWLRTALQSSQANYVVPDGSRDDGATPVEFTTTSGGQHTELGATVAAFNAQGVQLEAGGLTHFQGGSSGASTSESGSPGASGSGDAEGYTSDSLNGTVSDVLTTGPSTARDLVTASVPDPDGGQIPVDASHPAYSPDGSQIAYSEATDAYAGGVVGRRIYVANADGTGAFALDDSWNSQPGEIDVDTTPAWSPDGDSLAFTRITTVRYEFTTSGGTEIFSRRVSSARVIIATGLSTASADAPTVTVFPLDTPDAGSYWDTSPSWSPDGSAIVLVRDPLADVVPSATVPTGTTVVSSGYETADTQVTATVTNNGVSTASDVSAVVRFQPGADDARFVPSTPYPSGCNPTATNSSHEVTELTCAIGGLGAGQHDDIQIKGTAEVQCNGSGAAGVFVNASTATMESNYPNDTMQNPATFQVQSPDDATTCGLGVSGQLWHGWTTRSARAGTVTSASSARPMAVAPQTIGDATRDAIRGLADDALDPADGSPGTGAQLWVEQMDDGGDGAPLGTSACPTCATAGRSPAWAPDGLHIAYENNGVIYDASLTDADGDGTADSPDTVSSTASVTGYSTYEPLGDTPELVPTAARSTVSQAFDPAWWPDSSAIVFTGQPLDQPTQHDIYMVNTDGTGIKQLTNGRNPESEAAVQPFDDVAVTMTATPNSIRVGDTSQVSATVTNNGAATATGISLTVQVPTGMEVDTEDASCTPAVPLEGPTTITCPVPDLPAGVSFAPLVFGVTGTAQGSATFVGTVGARLPDADHSNDTSQATIRVGPRQADLSLTLTSAPSSIAIGGMSTLTATASNAGPSDAPNPTLTLTVPSGMTITSEDITCTPAAPVTGPATITCGIESLLAGTSATLTFQTTGSTPGTYTFTGHVGSDATDPDTTNNTASTKVTVRPKPTRPADLAVTVSLTSPDVTVGDSDTASITVENQGPFAAVNARLTTTFAPALHATASPSCAAGGTCSLGTLASGASETFIVTVEPQSVGHPPHDYNSIISASVTSDTPDPVSSNNTDQATLHVHQPGNPPVTKADLVVTVRMDPIAYVGGRDSNARITVRNNGVRTAQDVRLHVSAPGRLDAGATPSCAAGGTCSLGTLVAGAHRTFAVTLHPQRLRPAHSYTSVVVARASTTTSETTLRNNRDSDSVRVKQPLLRLLPPIGAPGFVTLAFAQNLPPHVPVTMAWKTGITSDDGPYRVDTDGTVEASVLVVRRDQLGVRKLVLRGPAGRFGEIETKMLVVPRTEAPPRFLGRG